MRVQLSEWDWGMGFSPHLCHWPSGEPLDNLFIFLFTVREPRDQDGPGWEKLSVPLSQAAVSYWENLFLVVGGEDLGSILG